MVENKKPNEVKEIKIVDPACGSGSFLIGAYQFLLNWHLQYYSNNKTATKKDNALTPTGTLTTAIKKQILLNNIYGVDLDANAVEVTKLSLLLKCMEGETSASIAHQHSMFNERVLPTLDNNIKSGNSLIDFDIYDNQLDLGEEKKIKPFNWQKAFLEVFNRNVVTEKDNLKQIATKAKQHAKKAMEYAEELEEKLNIANEPKAESKKQNGGFDVVIGNPPYLKLTANNSENEILNYYQNKYTSYSGGSSKNLFQLFLEKTISISTNYFAFIIPEALLTTESNGKTRELLLQNFNINSIVTFDHFVFEEATIGTTIVVGEKNNSKKTQILKTDRLKNTIQTQETRLEISKNTWDVSFDDESKTIFKKLLKKAVLMVDLVEMSKGMVVKNRNEVLTQFPTKNSLPFLLGNCMQRYFYAYDKYAEYDKLEIIGGTRNYSKQTKTPRLLIRRTGSNLCVTYSDKEELIESTIYILRSEKINLKFLLGLLNSKLLSFYLSKRLITNTQGFPQVLMGQLEQLPIIIANKQLQNDIIKLVDQLLLLNKEKQEARLESKIEILDGKIDYCEDQINTKVYELYELSTEEINIVRGK